MGSSDDVCDITIACQIWLEQVEGGKIPKGFLDTSGDVCNMPFSTLLSLGVRDDKVSVITAIPLLLTHVSPSSPACSSPSPHCHQALLVFAVWGQASVRR